MTGGRPLLLVMVAVEEVNLLLLSDLAFGREPSIFFNVRPSSGSGSHGRALFDQITAEHTRKEPLTHSESHPSINHHLLLLLLLPIPSARESPISESSSPLVH